MLLLSGCIACLVDTGFTSLLATWFIGLMQNTVVSTPYVYNWRIKILVAKNQHSLIIMKKSVSIIVLLVLSGCATYLAQPVAPAALMNAFEARTLDDPALRRYIVAHCGDAGACAPGVWDLNTLTLAALVAITLLIAGSAHVATQHASDVLRYSPATGSEL